MRLSSNQIEGEKQSDKKRFDSAHSLLFPFPVKTPATGIVERESRMPVGTITRKHALEEQCATNESKGNLTLYYLLDGSLKHLILLILTIGLHDENDLLCFIHRVSFQNEATHITKLDYGIG